MPLPPKVIGLLVLLVSARGKIVDRQQIFDALWPDTHVEERNLTQTVFLLRKALGDSTEHPTYLLTVPKRGYRFGGLSSPVGEENRRAGAWKKYALAAGAVLLIGTGMALFSWRARPSSAPSRLVVLPFVNMSADPDTEYFSDGLSEELINALTRVEGLRVVARTTAFQFKGKANDIRQIGKQLNVDAVLEGSVRKQGDRLRVTAQLNNAADGYHYWSETFDRETRDPFAVQEEIANLVAASLRKQPATVRRQRTGVNLEAYNLYLRGLHEQHKVLGGGLQRAIAYYEQAIAKDPNLAEAYAGIAHSYVRQCYVGQMAPNACYPKAKEYWTRALELDKNLVEALTVKSAALLHYERDLVGAARSLRETIALNPSYADARHWYSHCLVAMGRIEESRQESLRALEVDPLSLENASHLAWHYNMAGDFPKAVTAAQAALAIDPMHVVAKNFLREALVETGRLDEAVKLDAEADSGSSPRILLGFREGGAAGYWKTRIEILQERLREGAQVHVSIAQAYARLGQKIPAMRWLREALKERNPGVVYIRTEPAFKELRSDPEFRALAQEIGLP